MSREAAIPPRRRFARLGVHRRLGRILRTFRLRLRLTGAVRAAVVLGKSNKDFEDVEPPPGGVNAFLLGSVRHDMVDEGRPSLISWHIRGRIPLC